MILMAILCLIVLALYVFVEAIQPQRTMVSKFELERRHTTGDKAASDALRRETLLADILSLKRIKASFLLVVFVLLSVTTFGWIVGSLLGLIVVLEGGAIARLGIVRRTAQKLYAPCEPALLRLVESYPAVFRFIRIAMPDFSVNQLSSREELQHLVEQSTGLVSNNEKTLMLNTLTSTTKTAGDVMTPSGTIDTISKNELLGPLTLDALHKTGHSRFPVIDGDIDHVVGMLYIQNLFTLDAKRSVTAEKAMEPKVFYIRQDQTLEHALAAFLRTHHHLFVVVNEYRETVGLLSLEDVVEALLGRKIIDEFDTHEDLRAVAERNLRGNNQPAKHENV